MDTHLGRADSLIRIIRDSLAALTAEVIRLQHENELLTQRLHEQAKEQPK
jgi:hypothetical protein